MEAIRFGRVAGAGWSQSWVASAAEDHPLVLGDGDEVGAAAHGDGGEQLQRPLLED